MIFINNSYFRDFPGNPLYSNNIQIPNQTTTTNYTALLQEQSYVENILRLNKGKKVKIYQSYADAGEWKDKIFTGIIENSGRDHIILSDPNTGHWYLLLMIYVDFIEFDEEINTSEQFYPNR